MPQQAFCNQNHFAVPYGLGAGAIDASVNHYVANKLINFILHQFGGLHKLWDAPDFHLQRVTLALQTGLSLYISPIFYI